MKEATERLTFLEKFISKHYLSQPPWARTGTYLILLGLFVYSFFRLVGGEFSVTGDVMEEDEKGQLQSAINYEVQVGVGEKLFATNSQGTYYLVLSPLQYYRLLATGKVALVIRAQWVGGPVTDSITKYLYVDGRLDRVKVPVRGLIPQTDNGNASPASLNASPASLMDIFGKAAWATQSNDTSRLFVESIALKEGLPSVKEGTLVLEMRGTTSDLHYTATGGAAVRSISLESGRTVLLGNDYYFSVPKNLSLPTKAGITLSAKSGFLSRYTETFDLSAASREPDGQSFLVKGDQGSEIRIRLALMYDFLIWNKRDISEVMETLKADAEKIGLRVTIGQSPRGFEAETNAVFAGEAVPFQVVQSVLKVLRKNHVRLKMIFYPWTLRSKNPQEIQIGGTNYLNDREEIPEAKMERLLNAKTEKGFTDETADYVAYLKKIYGSQ